MASSLSTFLRRRWLKKYSSRIPTGLLPLKAIKKAIVITDGTAAQSMRYAAVLEDFLTGCGIESSYIYIDLRKIRKDTTVYVCGDNVITRRDINIFGLPSLRKKGNLFTKETDLLINLFDTQDFTLDFISKVSPSRFKIGCCPYQGNAFDLILSDPAAGPVVTGSEAAENETVAKNPEDTPKTLKRIYAICNFLKTIIG